MLAAVYKDICNIVDSTDEVAEQGGEGK